MPTIIDELVVKLKLDPTGYRRGRQEVTDDMKKTSEAARKHGSEIEEAGKKASQFYSKLRNEAITLFAVFAGAAGITAFIRNTTAADAAAGRLAHSMAMSTEMLTAWQGAAKRSGGTAEATAASFFGLTQQFQQFAATGQSSVMPFFRFLQVAVTDADNKVRPLNDILLDLSDRFAGMDPRQATYFGSQLGLDQGTINLLMQGRKAVEGFLESQRKLGVTTDKDAEAAQRLIASVLAISDAVTRLGRSIITTVEGDIRKFLEAMQKWIELNREWIEQDIVAAIRKFFDMFSNFNWAQISRDLKALWGEVDKIAEAVGGWANAGKILFGVWAVSKLSAVAVAIGAIGAALMNPAVIAALGVWLAYYAAAEKFRAPASQEEYDKRMGALPPGSPLWRDIPRRDQLRFPNSPASRGGGDDSWAQKNMPWLVPPTQSPIADESMSPYQRGFLEALSYPESRGDYTIMNGGKERIPDFSKHPGRVGEGGTSTATGRYQFTIDTWREAAAALGLTDFSPASQDRAAWWLASKEYRRLTGRDLASDLEEGDHEDQIAAALRGRWPSLPGGSQSQQSSDQFKAAVRSRTGANLPTLPKNSTGSPGAPPSMDPGLSAPPIPSGLGLASAGDGAGTINSETNINGPITVVTQATDADGIARSLDRALKQRIGSFEVNTGLV